MDMHETKYALFSREQVTLTPFELWAFDNYKLPGAFLRKVFGDNITTKLVSAVGEVPERLFIEVAGVSQKFSNRFGGPDAGSIVRTRLREAGAVFVVPLIAMAAAPVAIKGAKQGYKMYKDSQKKKR